MYDNYRKVPDVPDSFVITVTRTHAHARNAYIREPGTSGTPGIFASPTCPGNRGLRPAKLHCPEQLVLFEGIAR